MTSPVEQLADAVLYEGCNLYPYRPSALKNRHRWLFGSVLPRQWCKRHPSGERWSVQTQVLLLGGPHTQVDVQLRFLQNAEPRDVTERFRIGDLLQHERHQRITFPAESDSTVFQAGDCDAAGVNVRDRRTLEASLRVDCEPCDRSTDAKGLHRLTVCLENVTEIPESLVQTMPRDVALLSSFVSLHVLLHAVDGEFVSSIDPPSQFRNEAEACENVGLWPVLVGDARPPATVLAAPIILEDFPRIAPESPGDLFDGTEIDELLSLRIRTLTDDEKREAASTDERTRQLLQRTEALDQDNLARLHGTFRDSSLRRTDGDGFQPGDRVRLRPTRRADAFDLLLDGRVAVVTAVERDFEDEVHLAVTVEDDPGQDLGASGMPGHRFFFRPEEVERLDEEECS